MEGTIAKQKVIITYLIFAFSLAWAMWGTLALLEIDMSSSLGVAVLIASMWTPSAAVLITKKLNGGNRMIEPSFKPKFKGNVRWYLIAWLVPVATGLLGGAIYFAIFPQHFDSGLGLIRTALEQEQPGIALTDSAVQTVFVSQALLVITVAVALAVPRTLGEEIGWRGFLYPAVRNRTTAVKAHIYCGVIWGLWHAPIIAMGHNYGVGYPWFPWLGILAMTVFCMSVGVFLSYITDQSGSIWPATLAHAANNAAIGLSFLFASSDLSLDNTLVPGFIIGVPYTLLGAVLLVLYARKNTANR